MLLGIEEFTLQLLEALLADASPLADALELTQLLEAISTIARPLPGAAVIHSVTAQHRGKRCSLQLGTVLKSQPRCRGPYGFS